MNFNIFLIFFLVVLLIFIIIFILYNNKNIGVKKYCIKDSKIKKGIVIVQISDFHNTKFRKNKLVKLIKENKPDLIVITGDFIDSHHTNINTAINCIKDISSIAPLYFIRGNHEILAKKSYEKLAKSMKELGVHILINNVEEVEIKNENITIIGIDSIDYDSVSKKLDNLSYNSNNYTILLSHRPDLFKAYNNRKINLVFTGHAHGGQFRIPFIGGVFAPNQGIFPKYTSGIFEGNDGTKMIVSRGLGNSSFPFRLNNNPELIVVNLER